MEEMVFCGCQWGTFKPEGRSERVPFASVFVLQTFSDGVGEDSDFHTDGMKAVKYKMASADVVGNVGLFDVCEVYFSSKGVVIKLVPTGKNLFDSMAARVGGV